MLGYLPDLKLVDKFKLMQFFRNELFKKFFSLLLSSIDLPTLGGKQCADSVLAGVTDTLGLATGPVIKSLSLRTKGTNGANRANEVFRLQAKVLY